MKIIFLDFDGVLVTHRTIRNKRIEEKADAAAIAALNRLIEITDAQIVISSTWRAQGPSKMREYLALWGVKGKFLGLTPDLTRQYGGLFLSTSRSEEISRWMRDYPPTSEPIESYVIIDDDPIEPPQDVHQVRTLFDTGFTSDQVNEALAILEKSMQWSPTSR